MAGIVYVYLIAIVCIVGQLFNIMFVMLLELCCKRFAIIADDRLSCSFS